ncbi:ABC transporter ATP-binding protein [[Clostridium] polysaccharolyticum]|uniref:Putative ABC transport system ATP-binding protein n=1 Tax=[Clostridium] polysaccharolyticum TaxID=29364 RepID=A0A1H9Z794_9FIRM|nr:ABC transporter ATP-binding protein [[Clostridium] polysaccharolyticum]SES77348.1 putative ABC transport system ATP-binding protein [[Clostridium] polysaccharolyticum]
MLIRLRNISKVYKGAGFQVNALCDVNLDIPEGEILAIMGTSGSGKSTLLNILGCLDIPTGGSYLLDGKEISDYSEREMAHLRNDVFGFVLQDFALIERYTVAKNVMLPLYYGTVPRRKRTEKVESILKKVGLLEKKNQMALHLSGGQRQRVAIARALVNDSKIILCDEPTGALDKKTGNDIMELFKQMNKEGKTVIIVTHDPVIADMCHRVVDISDGKLVEREENKN